MALRSDCTGEATASETLVVVAKRPPAFRVSFHEGRGPPIRGGLRPEPPILANHVLFGEETANSGRFRLLRSGDRGACRSGLRPDLGNVKVRTLSTSGLARLVIGEVDCDGGELFQGSFEVGGDLQGEDVWVGEIGGVFEALVAEPE